MAGAASRPSWRKRLAFVLIPIVALGLLAEGLAYAALLAVEGGGWSLGRLHSERDALAAGRVAPRAPGETRALGAPAGPHEVVHPYVGYVLNADRRAELEREGLSVNEYGLSGPSPLQTRGPDRVVVALLGGSLASALLDVDSVPPLVTALQRVPAWRDKRFVFVNLALDGYKQPQQIAAMSYLLTAGAQFDVAINVDGFNEVALYLAENAAAGVSPLFPRGWALRARGLPDVDSERLAGEVLYLEEVRRGWARALASPPWRHSRTATLVWRLRDRALERRLYADRRALQMARPAAAPYVVTGPPTPRVSEPQTYADLAAIWQRGSALLAGLCAARGIRYYHFLEPSQHLPGGKPRGSAERRAGTAAAPPPYQRAVELGYPVLMRAGRDLAAQGVRFADLTAVFAGVAEPVFSDACCHLNAAGKRIVLRRIAEAIVADAGAAP